MKQPPAFATIKNSLRFVSLQGQLKIDMTYDELLDLIKMFVKSVPFDEAWYLRSYPDVEEAVRAGIYRDARQHFIDHGYFEGRHSSPPDVDEDWYLATYPDVAESVRAGAVASARDHFLRHGYNEGRQPAAA